jgi:hypothetical protein
VSRRVADPLVEVPDGRAVVGAIADGAALFAVAAVQVATDEIDCWLFIRKEPTFSRRMALRTWPSVACYGRRIPIRCPPWFRDRMTRALWSFGWKSAASKTPSAPRMRGLPICLLRWFTDCVTIGVPVVGTSLVATQLGWTDGVDLLVADDADAFAEQCCSLYTDPGKWHAVRDSAHARITLECSPVVFRSTLQEALLDAQASRSADGRRIGVGPQTEFISR